MICRSSEFHRPRARTTNTPLSFVFFLQSGMLAIRKWLTKGRRITDSRKRGKLAPKLARFVNVACVRLTVVGPSVRWPRGLMGGRFSLKRFTVSHALQPAGWLPPAVIQVIPAYIVPVPGPSARAIPGDVLYTSAILGGIFFVRHLSRWGMILFRYGGSSFLPSYSTDNSFSLT